MAVLPVTGLLTRNFLTSLKTKDKSSNFENTTRNRLWRLKQIYIWVTVRMF